MRRILPLLLVLFAGAARADLDRLEPLPHPELGGFETAVREQLEEQRAALDRLLTAPDAADLAAAFGRLGQLYHLYGLLDAATVCYRNARHLASGEADWIYLFGVVRQREGELDEAAASFGRVLELVPGDPPSLVRLGEVELDRRAFDAASRLFEQALPVAGVTAAAHAGLGRVAMARRDFAVAAEHFEQALALQPSAKRLRYTLAQAYRRLGRLEEASAQLEQQGSDPVAIDDPRMAVVLGASASGIERMQRAATARRAGLLDQAEEEYRQAVEIEPENPEARLGLAGVLAEKEAYAESLEQYREAVRLTPDNAGIRSNFGAVRALIGRPEEALESFRAAVRLDPEDGRFRRRLASQLASMGSFEQAAGEYREILKRDRDDVGALLELAAIEARLGDHEAVRELASAVLDLDVEPWERARALVLIADVHGRAGERSQAIEALEQAVELDPLSATARFSLANFLGMAGRYVEAADSYRMARQREPGNLTAWVGESTALVLSGREAEAIASLEEGLAAHPGEARLTGGLARLLVDASDPGLRDGARALELAQSVFHETPSLDLAETIALALATLERYDEAAAWQERIVASVEGAGDPALLERQRAALERYRRGGSR